MTKRFDIEVPQGLVWRREFGFYDTYLGVDNPGNVPIDLTDWTVKAQLRENEDGPVIADIAVTISGNVATLVIDNTARTIRPCRWDMIIVRPGGDPEKPWEGDVKVPTTITRL